MKLSTGVARLWLVAVGKIRMFITHQPLGFCILPPGLGVYAFWIFVVFCPLVSPAAFLSGSSQDPSSAHLRGNRLEFGSPHRSLFCDLLKTSLRRPGVAVWGIL